MPSFRFATIPQVTCANFREKGLAVLHVPLIARDQLRLAALQVRDRPKTVVLQLENVIGMVEGFPHQTEPHGVNAREHNSSLHLECASCSERTRATLGMSKSTATRHILINTGLVISGLRTKNPCKFDVKLHNQRIP